MIVDVRAYVGHSIYGYGLTAEQLLTAMDGLGIASAVVCPVQPHDYHLEPANDEVAAAVLAHSDRLLGFCRVDPRRGSSAVKEVHRAVTELGLRGIFLHPWEEGYSIDSAIVEPVMQSAATFGIPIMVAAGHPWYAHPLQVADLAHRFPDQPIIMTHGGQLNISGLAQQDAFTALRECPNLCVEVSGVYRQDFIEEVVEELGADRVLFGSGTPQMHQAFELERIRALKIEETGREQILAGNACALLQFAVSKGGDLRKG